MTPKSGADAKNLVGPGAADYGSGNVARTLSPTASDPKTLDSLQGNGGVVTAVEATTTILTTVMHSNRHKYTSNIVSGALQAQAVEI